MTDAMAMRKRVQQLLGLGITAAQDWCAAAVHTSRRAWQQWETGDRSMHPAFVELAEIKIEREALRGRSRPRRNDRVV